MAPRVPRTKKIEYALLVAEVLEGHAFSLRPPPTIRTGLNSRLLLSYSHDSVYHSTLGLRVTKQKRRTWMAPRTKKSEYALLVAGVSVGPHTQQFT